MKWKRAGREWFADCCKQEGAPDVVVGLGSGTAGAGFVCWGRLGKIGLQEYSFKIGCLSVAEQFGFFR